MPLPHTPQCEVVSLKSRLSYEISRELQLPYDTDKYIMTSPTKRTSVLLTNACPSLRPSVRPCVRASVCPPVCLSDIGSASQPLHGKLS